MDLQQLKNKFIEETKQHIKEVNEFAAKIGLEFPDHDNSKLDLLLDGYCYYSKPKNERTEEENEILDLATFIHVKNSPHHPEYWSKTDLTGFTRSNYTPNGTIDATDMPEYCLKEMVCDWCSRSLKYGNTPTEWFNRVNGTRWLFTMEQQNIIRDTIEKVWDNG